LHDYEGDLGGSPTEPCFTPEDIIANDAEDQAKDLARYGHKSTNVFADYTQSSILRNDNLRNHWWGGARKRINQKGSEPGNAIISGDSP
jgi:hypothetical protein